MPTPNPLAPVKGAGTTLWLYTGSGNAFANPLSDIDWSRLAKIKELTPGEMTAESYDDTYLDDEDADWNATAQGAKSAGDTSLTLARKPGEQGQKELVTRFNDGSVRVYKIKYPNGTVDVFRGWCSSLVKLSRQKRLLPAQRKSPILASLNWLKKVVLRPLLLQASRLINPRQASLLRRPPRLM